MPSPSRILIVGGGIAGLALSRALREQGVVPEVIERATSWPTRGTGLYLPGNGACSSRLYVPSANPGSYGTTAGRTSSEATHAQVSARLTGGILRSMNARLADMTGTVMTTIAGVLVAVLSLSTFGAAPTLFGFLALFLLATAFHSATSHHR